MSSKKNIDRLFQEKFKEFDVKPDPKVWKSIESKLKKEEKDDKVVIIPFWLKLSGIAASLLLLFFLGDALFNNTEKSTIPKVVETEKTNSKESINKNEDNFNKIELKNQDSTKTANQETDSPTKTTTVVGTESDVTNDTVSNINNNKNSIYKTTNGSNKLVNNTNFSGNSSEENNKVNSLTNNIAQNNNNNKSTQNIDDSNISSNKKQLNTTTDSPLIKNAVAANKNENNEEITKEEEEELKLTIEDAIAETKDKEKLIEEEKTNKWSINTNFAPVYYNSFGEGSHLHEQFNENSKTGEVNTSFGIKVGYALNDKLTIRSGVNKLNLSYDTDDVVVYEKLGDNSNLRNIDFSTSNSGQQLNMISARDVNIIEDTKSLNSGISQQMSYYEVPLEVEYKLLSKRIGVNIIGGFSTFLLDDNQLRSELNGVDSKIGEANNINSVSFSTNLGIGIDYKFSKAFVLNLEPTFKYHLNAFNNTSGSFNPYIIGLYTGVSYRF